MKRVVFTVGLPASGKTTWALNRIKDIPEMIKRVNKDDLRAMIDGGKYSKQNEFEINRVLEGIAYHYLQHTESNIVIIDGCNLKKHIDDYTSYIKEHTKHFESPVEFEIKIFNVSPEICIERNKDRNNGLPEKAIWGLLKRYQEEGIFTEYKLKIEEV